MDIKEVQQAIADLGLKVTGVTEQLKKDSEVLQSEMKNLGKATDETKAKVDEALTGHTDLKGRIAQMEQIVVRLRDSNGGAQPVKTIGQEVTDSEAFKAFGAQKTKGRVAVEVTQAITSLTTDADGSVGAAIRADRLAGVLQPARRRMTIRGLLMPGRTTSNAIEYVREKGFTNNADIQAKEGDQKAESSIQFELKSANVRTIAHFMQVSTQALDDVAQLQSYIDGSLRYGLNLKEEQQLLAGSGAGVELEGLYTAAAAFNPAFLPASTTFIDILRLAMLQTTLAEWPATAHVLNPIDWAKIETTKDQEDRYIFANPQALAGPTLWGLPVVETQAMRPDKFLVGAFTPAAQIFDRLNPVVIVSTEDRDNIIKNMVTILAEERLTLVIFRPEALVKGDFGAGS